MKKLAVLIVFAFAMVLFSDRFTHAEEYPSPRDPVDESEEGVTEENGPEEPLPPFA